VAGALIDILRGRSDDEKDQVSKAGIRDTVPNAGRDEHDIVLADDARLTVEFYEAFPFQHVEDLLLDLMDVLLDVRFGLVARDAVVDPARSAILCRDKGLGKRPAEMAWELLPGHLGDVADNCSGLLFFGTRH
jgi:hypothetical protein